MSSGSLPPGGGGGAPLPPGVLLALRPLLELAKVEQATTADAARLSTRVGRATQLTLAFYIDMMRGMQEFRRAYGMPGGAAEAGADSAQGLLARLVAAPDPEALLREMEENLQELKVHHAALLEGYNEAAQDGTREILRTLDPEQIRKDLKGTSVRVGPLRLSTGFRPVLVQAVWEEFLRRFRRLKSLESADFEKFFREGFRNGYRKFQESRRPRASG